MLMEPNRAFNFVILLGIVSLLSDATYEGARSIIGPFLATLGATGTAIGFISGLGELISYGVRLISGHLSDLTGKPWLFVFTGYILNLFSIPLLAITENWQTASVLVIGERLGKAIRTPVRDTLLSYATSKIGRGKGFGLHEAMDQTGAIIGPIVVAFVITLTGNLRDGFKILVIPAILAIVTLCIAKLYYPNPAELEDTNAGNDIPIKRLPKKLWLYLIAITLVSAGYIDYPLIAYHLTKNKVVSTTEIPIIYALGMGCDAIGALAFGYLFDRIGFYTLAISTIISSTFAPLIFLGNSKLSLVGIVIWGIGLGAHESVLRAAVASMVQPEARSTAYGIFNATYGISWFVGSAIIGILYDTSIIAVVLSSLITQLLSVIVLIKVSKQHN